MADELTIDEMEREVSVYFGEMRGQLLVPHVPAVTEIVNAEWAKLDRLELLCCDGLRLRKMESGLTDDDRLRERDEFIVREGLWEKFCAQLPPPPEGKGR